MSKRVANTKDDTARFGRVRIGWKKHRMLSTLEKQLERDNEGKLDEMAKAKLAHYAAKVKAIIPKQFLRRYQIR